MHRRALAEHSAKRQPGMVNAALTNFVGTRSRLGGYGRGMDLPFIHGRGALADASELIDRFGEEAAGEAAARAEQSRDDGNVVRFCHWRQIERVIAALSSEEVRGSVH